MNVNERKLRILRIIIDDFINTAQPVGSRTIAKKYPVGISPATVRNEMSDLEELGFLMQPHTSAGRIPSDLAYRFYVDNMLDEPNIPIDKKQLVKKLLLNNLIEVEDIAKQAVELLCNLTGTYAAITMPQFKKSAFSNVKLVKINEKKVLLIIIAESGIIKTLQLSLLNSTQEILDRISDRLVYNLAGSPIEEFNVRNLNLIKMEMPQYSEVFDYLIPIMRNVLVEIDEKDVYFKGTNLIMDNMELKDVTDVKGLLSILEDKESVYKIIKSEKQDGIDVKIGGEIGIKEFEDCSVVSGVFQFNGNNIGNIGVVGSKRMDYSNAISSINFVRETLSEIFAGINL